MGSFSEEDNKLIEQEFEGLRDSSKKRCANEQEFQEVLKAFNLANEAHKGVRRRSGEPYILHPIAVAKIVVQEIGLGYKSICAALLHDVVEDTDYTTDDIRRLFGDKITSLVDGLTKMKTALQNDSELDQKSLQAENFKRILLTLNDDIRVILIKLADRLHNVRTIEFMPEAKRDKILSETMYIFIPFAHRLGLYSIKSEMENIWLKYKEPEAYENIKERLKYIMQVRDNSIDEFIEPISKRLKKAGYSFHILKRMKTPYSIWKKMTARQIPFEEIYDIYAVRIIFDPKGDLSEHDQCYNIYRMITDIYPNRERVDRYRNFLSHPKSNGYEALHCTIMSPSGHWIEVQIRSDRMNKIAERGVAAHWAYKNQQTLGQHDQKIDEWLDKIKKVVENPDANALELLDTIHEELVTSEIYVFTPKGESKQLQKGYTALDFAYIIHSQIGNKAIAAKVNQKLVPLSTVLHTGDQVEIITSDSSRPKREWLTFLKSSRARSEVMDTLRENTKGNIKEGMNILASELSKHGLTPSSRVIKKLIEAYKVIGGKEELYAKIGIGIIDLSDLGTILTKNNEKKLIKIWGLDITDIIKPSKIEKGKDYILEENISEGTISYNIADCCNPIPGDNIVGFVDDDGKVTIHKKSCALAQNLASKRGEKIVQVKWSKHTILSFLARISLRGIDRIGIINDITREISLVLNVNIRKLFIQSHDGIFDGYIDLYVHNTKDLEDIIKKLKKIKGVDLANRVDINE